MSDSAELKKVIDQLKRWNLLSEKSGNMSVRAKEDRNIFTITPSGMNYDTISEEDMVQINVENGKILSSHRKPSIEKDLHRFIYAAREDVNAVIHVHSTWATVMACARKELPPIMAETLGVKLCDYACPGSIDLAKICVDALGKEENALLMSSHGLIVIGKNLSSTMSSCLQIEESCKVYVLASTIGGAVPLTPNEVEEIKIMLKSHGQ